jgi:hypothetical protein
MLPRPKLPRPSSPAAQLRHRGAYDLQLASRASKPVTPAAFPEKKKSRKSNDDEDRSVAVAPRSPLVLLCSLFAAGAILGPLLDGIHGAFGLLEYDLAPIELGDDLGSLHTSLTVPLLLGTFYAASGALHVWGDEVFKTPTPTKTATTRRRRTPLSLPLPLPCPGPALAAYALALVAAHLALSALLYDAAVLLPPQQVALALYLSAFFIWLSLDRTATGAALAVVTAAAAPLAELLLMNLFGVWHYPRADFFLGALGDTEGIVSWVPACYAGYSVWVGALARWWWRAGGGGGAGRGGIEKK